MIDSPNKKQSASSSKQTGSKMFNSLKNNLSLQNFVVGFVTSIHPAVMHNLGKIEMLKKALWHCELENVQGSYFEFGVFQGTSLLTAVKAFRNLKSQIKRRFYGFDAFDTGFRYFDERDQHPFFQEGGFSVPYERVSRRLRKYNEVELIRGYFEHSLTESRALDLRNQEKCAIAFIDCDLMNPALLSLEYIRPLLQAGSVIILDDYWAYKGNSALGIAGALGSFLQNNPSVRLREFFRYGYGGTSFIVESV
ncbi:class I SAM-dependent methyltransferase [Patescibacteria group bacterium]|nr:class I SAM-dependent methyltransferase [Patescibacteria group bacterium]